jgi:hypothetical protein|tara:strand:- start:942 stop:1049 length:108 start_codon:yes stop_codon:yes gene_type:complete
MGKIEEVAKTDALFDKRFLIISLPLILWQAQAHEV